LTRVIWILDLCRQFGQLPEQIKAADAELMYLLNVEAEAGMTPRFDWRRRDDAEQE
jgi:hypothetical protein